MEWSWRTVLILLGLLLVAGVLFDGFRRMRKARAEALRFDLEKEVGSDELYHNPELPGTYRVVGSHTTDASYVDDPIFAQDDTEEVHVQEPFFDEEPAAAENIVVSTSAVDDVADQSKYENTKPLDSKIEPVDEPIIEQDLSIDEQEEMAADANLEENEFEEHELEETVAQQNEAPEAETVTPRPVNLDEDFPVLLDVEELGAEEVAPQPTFAQTEEDTEIDFQEKDANPFAELEMEEVDAPVEEVKTQLEENPIIDEDADCFAELNENNDEQSVDDDLSAESNESELDTKVEEETVESIDAEIEKPTEPAPLLFASAEAEKLSDRAEPQLALVIHCISRDEKGFSGADIVNLFTECDIRFGEREIFHRFEQPGGKGNIQFSIVHSFEPRHFSPETILDDHFRGLSLFMKLPGAKDPSAAYEAMSTVARLLAKHFNADLYDGERSALTQQTIEHERQQIVDFEFRQKVAARKQALL